MGDFRLNANGSTLAAAGQPSFTGLALHTSAMNIPITIFWGRRRVAPNIIWMSQGDAQGGVGNWQQYGGATIGPMPVTDSPFPSYPSPFGQYIGTSNTLWVPAIFALCEGPITSFGPCWDGSRYLYATQEYTVGSSPAPSTTFIPWNGSPPADVSAYFGTTLNVIDGPAQGNFVKILAADATGIYLAAPLTGTPVSGNHYFAVAGDQSTANAGAGIYQLNMYYQGKLGSLTEPLWNFFTHFDPTGASYGPNSQIGDQQLTYPGTCYVASMACMCGSGPVQVANTTYFDTTIDQPVFPQQSFELTRIPTAAYGSPTNDYSPYDIVFDLLTNTQYGMGMSPGDIDNTSHTDYLNYCMAQGIFFSPLLSGQDKANDIIERWATLSNSWIFWDGTDFTHTPIGDIEI